MRYELLIKLCLCIFWVISWVFAESNTDCRHDDTRCIGYTRYTQWCAQLLSHEQQSASFQATPE